MDGLFHFRASHFADLAPCRANVPRWRRWLLQSGGNNRIAALSVAGLLFVLRSIFGAGLIASAIEAKGGYPACGGPWE